MSSSYDGVVEIKEMSADEANELLKEENWKLLEIKTLPFKIFKGSTVIDQRITKSKYKDVYDEGENVVYILGRIKEE